MPFRLSERTSNSRAASTISRFVFSPVSFRASRTNLSLISIFVLPMFASSIIFYDLGVLFSPSARKRPGQRQRRDVPCGPVRLPRIPLEVSLHHANDLHRALSIGHARQPVPSRHAHQLVMNQEALGKARHPAQAGRVTGRPRRVPVAFAVCAPCTAYTRADFQEVAPRSANIRLLWWAYRGSARRKTNKENTQQRSNQQ